MTMLEDLRECPFCGNENDFEGSPFPNGRRTSWIVRCGNPGCCAELIGDTAHEAVVRWNRRNHAEQIERDARDKRPNEQQVARAYARFLEINDGDEDLAKTDLGTFVIGWSAAMSKDSE